MRTMETAVMVTVHSWTYSVSLKLQPYLHYILKFHHKNEEILHLHIV